MIIVDLLGLLKWRNEPKKLENNLRALMKVGGEEIVKVRRGEKWDIRYHNGL